MDGRIWVLRVGLPCEVLLPQTPAPCARWTTSPLAPPPPTLPLNTIMHQVYKHVVRFTAGGVVLAKADGAEREVAADMVLLATGYDPAFGSFLEEVPFCCGCWASPAVAGCCVCPLYGWFRTPSGCCFGCCNDQRPPPLSPPEHPLSCSVTGGGCGGQERAWSRAVGGGRGRRPFLCRPQRLCGAHLRDGAGRLHHWRRHRERPGLGPVSE